jgi:hypothetical protein
MSDAIIELTTDHDVCLPASMAITKTGIRHERN